jgi:hypothetical protein
MYTSNNSSISNNSRKNASTLSDISDISYIDNEIRQAILNNSPIDDYLHVVMVISNPCLYQRRYILAKQFIRQMLQQELYVKLYIVELAYKDQSFMVTDKNNPTHLQLHTEHPLWHKENMINLGVKHLLPSDWKAMAWIDADIEFENCMWALDTLKILNGCRDIVQLFSHAVDMNANQDAMSIFSGFGFQYSKRRAYTKENINKMWHPGYAWACTRRTYERLGGLYEYSILGAGDNNIALSIIQQVEKSIHKDVHPDYHQSLLEYQNRGKNLRLGYVPGVIRHYFHGYKKNRKYTERWQILIHHQYSPFHHVTKYEDLLIPSSICPPDLLQDIMQYFTERNEDEGLS